MTNLLVVDTSVIIHAIHSVLEENNVQSSSEFERYVNASLAYIETGCFAPKLGSVACVWALDSKPYWRKKFEPDYKKGRKKKRNFSSLRNFVLGRIDGLGFPSYEADDVAAAVVKLAQENDFKGIERVCLLTVDSDWCGLVGERVLWLNTGPWEPRVRDDFLVYEWQKKKIGKQLKKFKELYELPSFNRWSPREIWRWKSRVGDPSDNLFEGTSLDMIDLFEPPEEYDLLTNERSKIVSAVSKSLNAAETLSKRKKEIILGELNALGLDYPIAPIVSDMLTSRSQVAVLTA